MRRTTALESVWRAQKCSGKNLLDISNYEVVGNPAYAISDNAIDVTFDWSNYIRFPLALKPNTTYTLSRSGTILSGQPYIYNYWCYFVINRAFITVSDRKFTFTTGGDLTSAVLELRSGDVGQWMHQIQSDIRIVQGSKETPYEPYCGGDTTQLTLNNCKGGYISTKEEYGLKVKGKTNVEQCVKQGSVITCGNNITVPCDLYEGDVWLPMSGKVYRADKSVENYAPQPCFLPRGTANILQAPVELSADLELTHLVRR